MFITIVQQKGASAPVNPLADFTGVQWATTFDEGSDGQVLYGVFDGYEISASNGVRGSGSGSDSADPTWHASGASFDGADKFSSVPYSGVLDFIDTTGDWTLYFRAQASSDTICFFNSSTGSWSQYGCYFMWYQPLGALFAVNDWNRHSTYYQYYSLNNDWHTHAIVNDGSSLKWYVDTVEVASFSPWTTERTAQVSDATKVTIGSVFGDTFFSGVNTLMRAFVACNVAHDSTERSNMHTLLAALPNAS